MADFTLVWIRLHRLYFSLRALTTHVSVIQLLSGKYESEGPEPGFWYQGDGGGKDKGWQEQLGPPQLRTGIPKTIMMSANYTLLSDTEHLIPGTPVLLLDLISENIALRTESKNYLQFVLILVNSNSKIFYIIEVNLPDMIMLTLVSGIYFNPWKR